MSTAADVLRFLARVVGEGHDRGLVLDVRRDGPVEKAVVGQQHPMDQPTVVEALTGARRWRKVVALHREAEPGRLGRLWLAGRGRVLGEEHRVCVPLLATPLQDDRRPPEEPMAPTAVADALGIGEALLLGAASTTPAAGRIDPALLRRMGRLSALVDALAASGTHVQAVGVADPLDVVDGDELWLCHQTAVYIDRAPLGPPSAQRLRRWAQADLRGTALQALYEPAGEVPADDAAGPDHPRSPLPLTPAQRSVVLTARNAPLSVVSGAPGTGKSHVAVAIALDAVAHGHSVLLATRSGHAADVLAGMIDRHPGPTPVRIGGGTTRRQLADRLAAGLPSGPSRAERAAAQEAEEVAAADLRRVHDELARLLAVARPDHRPSPTREALLRTEAPGAFTEPHAVLLELLSAARPAPDDGWLRRWWTSRRADLLRRRVGAAPDVPLDRIAEAVELRRRRALAAAIEDSGGLDLEPTREALASAQQRLREAVGTRLDLQARAAADLGGRRAVSALSAALRAGASRRAEQLARLDADELTDALPLWVGTVREVEDLLPATPGMFDLVVLDEASQLDQLVTAPVLCRARRAVVTGDPRQLRHVSFVADAEVDDALTASGLDDLADRLDVRRVSSFDAAAAVAPVRWLDEHLRSVPHLILFSAQRFYDRHLHVTTLHPSVETADAIDTLHVSPSGETGPDGVVPAEVHAVVAELERLLASEAQGTVGVVTPFRAQADALEAAVLDRFDLEDIESLGLRVGTVHAFQGGERDTVIISLGLTEQDPPQRRTFADDPHLVNVMVTRARRRVLVVTALPSGTGGLLGEYLRHAEEPPRPVPVRTSEDAWTRNLASELRRNGHAVRPGADRRHGVDLVVGEGPAAVGILTRPHPDGVGADIARHTALRRAGWRLLEVYPLPTDRDPVPRVLELRDRLPGR